MKRYLYKEYADRYWDEFQHGRITWDEFKEKMRKLIARAKKENAKAP